MKKRWMLLSVVFFACEAPDPALDRETAVQTEPLYSQSGTTLWYPNEQIPICFMATGFDTEKAIIRQAVHDAWERNGNVHFQWTGICPAIFGTDLRVKVLIEMGTDPGGGGSTNGMGRSTLHWPWDGRSVHIALPMSGDRGRIEYLAVHEFGHVLGFGHEQDRNDNTDPVGSTSGGNQCNPTGSIAGPYWTYYDRESVMNYCNSSNNASGRLSVEDKRGVSAVYGPGFGAVAAGTNFGAASTAPLDNPYVIRRFFFVTTGGELMEHRFRTNLARGVGAWEFVNHGGFPGRMLASSPSTAMYSGAKFFLRTSDGALVERYYDAAGHRWGWTDHGLPPGDTLASSPGAVYEAEPRLFAVGSSGLLWERYWNGYQWLWSNHGRAPGNVSLLSQPSETLQPQLKFFVTGSDGALWERYRDDASRVWGWTPHGRPANVTVNAGRHESPIGGIRHWQASFFVTGANGFLYRNMWNPYTGWVWYEYRGPFNGASGTGFIGMPSAPWEPQYKFFVRSRAGDIWQVEVDVPGGSTFNNMGRPPRYAGTAYAGTMSVVFPQDTKGFFRATDGRVDELSWRPTGWIWGDFVY